MKENEIAEQPTQSATANGYTETTGIVITVWRIEAKGLGTAYYEHNLRIIEDMLRECDFDEGYIITKHKMLKDEYENLPEFMGF